VTDSVIPHRWPLRVYYEDTDLAGIVYYANYLKFIERARSEMVREAGLDQREMKAAGLVFAVTRVEADYLSPARYDDTLVVETRPQALTPARFVLQQHVSRGDTLLFAAKVTLVCVNERGRAQRLPAQITNMATLR
jgi:acyl-CoA thioester hydrolase